MKFIAHRGYSSKYPENTMIAFEKAVLYGAPMIELDIALTLDQKIVVLHDDTLDRTSNGRGFVCEQTLSQIQKLDAGSWFDPKFSDQKIPPLENVLDSIGSEVGINIEIKKEAVSLDEDLTIEPILLELLARYTNLKDIQVSSFEPLALHRLRRMDPTLALCYLTVDKLSEQQREEMLYLNVVAQHLSIQAVDEDEIAKAHQENINIRTYTIKTLMDLNKAKSLGVDAVFINDLELA